MKKMKILGLIAIIAIIGFAMISCGDTLDCEDGCTFDWRVEEDFVITAANMSAIKVEEYCTVCGGQERNFKTDTISALDDFFSPAPTGSVDVTIKLTVSTFRSEAPPATTGGAVRFWQLANTNAWAAVTDSIGGYPHAIKFSGAMTKSNPTHINDEDSTTEVTIFYSTNLQNIRIKWGPTGLPTARVYTRVAN